MGEFLGDGATGDGHRVAVDKAGVQQAAKNDRNAADLEEVVHHARSTGLKIGDLRGAPRDLVKLLDINVDPGFRGECKQVEHSVRRTTGGDLQSDRVLKGLLRENVGGSAVVCDHIKRDLTGSFGDLVAILVFGRGRGRPQRREPECFADGCHRVSGEHPATGARTGTGMTFHLIEFVLTHLALGDRANALEDVLDRDLPAVVLARHDRAAVNEDRGEVGADHRHHHPRHVLVAAADGDEAIHSLAKGNKLDAVGDNLAADERGFHPLGSHRDRIRDRDRVELDRHPTGVVDARVCRLGYVVEVDVAGGDIRRTVCDPNHR
jgi:hypothetical protein